MAPRHGRRRSRSQRRRTAGWSLVAAVLVLGLAVGSMLAWSAAASSADTVDERATADAPAGAHSVSASAATVRAEEAAYLSVARAAGPLLAELRGVPMTTDPVLLATGYDLCRLASRAHGGWGEVAATASTVVVGGRRGSGGTQVTAYLVAAAHDHLCAADTPA